MFRPLGVHKKSIKDGDENYVEKASYDKSYVPLYANTPGFIAAFQTALHSPQHIYDRTNRE